MPYSHAAFIAAVLCIALGSTPAFAQPGQPLDHSTPLGIAQAWLEAVTSGDAELAAALSAVPFAYDGSRLIESRDALHAVYRQQDRAPLPPGSYAVAAEWPSFEARDVPPQCVPSRVACALVQFTLDARRESVYIFVDVRSAARVVGVRD